MEEGGMSAVPKTKTPSPVTPLSPTMMKDVKALVSLYSNYFWNRLLSILPNPNSNFRTKISSFYHSSTTTTTRGSSKRRRRTTCLPLPLPPASSPDSPSSLQASHSVHRYIIYIVIVIIFKLLVQCFCTNVDICLFGC